MGFPVKNAKQLATSVRKRYYNMHLCAHRNCFHPLLSIHLAHTPPALHGAYFKSVTTNKNNETKMKCHELVTGCNVQKLFKFETIDRNSTMHKYLYIVMRDAVGVAIAAVANCILPSSLPSLLSSSTHTHTHNFPPNFIATVNNVMGNGDRKFM